MTCMIVDIVRDRASPPDKRKRAIQLFSNPMHGKRLDAKHATFRGPALYSIEPDKRITVNNIRSRTCASCKKWKRHVSAEALR